MMDRRTVAQEVQGQLLAALHLGHKQLRKSQEQARKSQEQARSAVAEAVRNGNELAKVVRPSLPGLGGLADPARLRSSAQEFAGQVAARQRQLAGRALEVASPVADQLITAQREFAERALQVASPVVTDGLTLLTRAAATLPGLRRRPTTAAEPVDHVVRTAPATVATDEAASNGGYPNGADRSRARPGKPGAADRQRTHAFDRKGCRHQAGRDNHVGDSEAGHQAGDRQERDREDYWRQDGD